VLKTWNGRIWETTSDSEIKETAGTIGGREYVTTSLTKERAQRRKNFMNIGV
jgi:hypothetical protein